MSTEPTPLKEQSCANCHFYDPVIDAPEINRRNDGFCVRTPGQLLYDVGLMVKILEQDDQDSANAINPYVPARPRTSDTDWCGEWKLRATGEPHEIFPRYDSRGFRFPVPKTRQPEGPAKAE